MKYNKVRTDNGLEITFTDSNNKTTIFLFSHNLLVAMVETNNNKKATIIPNREINLIQKLDAFKFIKKYNLIPQKAKKMSNRSITFKFADLFTKSISGQVDFSKVNNLEEFIQNKIVELVS